MAMSGPAEPGRRFDGTTEGVRRRGCAGRSVQCFWARGPALPPQACTTPMVTSARCFDGPRSLHRKQHWSAYPALRGAATPRRHTVIFDDILRRSLNDRERKGCMVVNSALEMAPHDPESRETIAETLKRIESFFLACVEKGQADGTITSSRPAVGLAQHLLGVLMGVRVLARLRPGHRTRA